MNRNLKNTDKYIQNSESKLYFDFKKKKKNVTLTIINH